MAQVLEQMRASCETRNPFEQSEEQRDISNQSASASNSGHTEILPSTDELQDLRDLSPSNNEFFNKEDQTERAFESRNQSGDNVLLDQDRNADTIPLAPEENIAPLGQEINVDTTSLVPNENIISLNNNPHCYTIFWSSNLLSSHISVCVIMLFIDATFTVSCCKLQ